MGLIQRKLGGWLDKDRIFHADRTEYAEGCIAAEMRHGFNPEQKHPDFVRAYGEYTEQLYPLRHKNDK